MTVIVLPTEIFITAYHPDDFVNPLFDVLWESISLAEEHFCFDEEFLWSGITNASNLKQWRYTDEPPTLIKTLTPPATCDGLCHDGRYFWYLNQSTNLIYQLDELGNNLGSFTCKASSFGMDTDGRFLYTVSQNDNTVTTYDMQGNTMGTFAIGANSKSITTDGRFLWILYDDNVDTFEQRDFAGNLIKSYTISLGLDLAATLVTPTCVKFNKNDRFFYFSYKSQVGA